MTSTWRDSFIDASAALALLLVAITEALSAFAGLNRASVGLAWGFVLVVLIGWYARKGTLPDLLARANRPVIPHESTVYLAIFAVGAAITLYLALVAPPSALDAQSYHLPRVLRWIQDGTLRPFPTHVSRQIWIGPGWEYFQLHLQLVTGTGSLANLVQWFAFLANPVVVSVIARELGASHRGQMLAALFTFSIPMGIVQASGSQVDLFSAFWLAGTVALLLRIRRGGAASFTVQSAAILGVTAGMAVMAKATNALFLFPFIVWISSDIFRAGRLRFLRLAAGTVVVAALINAGPMLRNQAVFGSPLGPPPSRGSHTNDTFTLSAFGSNIIRNASLQLNTPSRAINRFLLDGIARTHEVMGIDIEDPRTTFDFRPFTIPLDQDDEGIASNQFHFLLIIGVTVWLLAKRRRSAQLAYMLCVLAGAVLFVVYLKWQPWHSRLHLPLFVVAGAAVAAALDKALGPKGLRLVAAGLVLAAIPPTIRHAWRPIVSRHAIFTMPYERRLFPQSPADYEAYKGAAQFIASRRCGSVGIVADGSALEYPLWKMLDRRLEQPLEIRHVGVLNATRGAQTGRDSSFHPCAVVELYKVPPESLSIAMLNVAFPDGVPHVPSNLKPAWTKGRITVYLPGKA